MLQSRALAPATANRNKSSIVATHICFSAISRDIDGDLTPTTGVDDGDLPCSMPEKQIDHLDPSTGCRDRSNLGCHCDVSGLWDQASNAEEEGEKSFPRFGLNRPACNRPASRAQRARRARRARGVQQARRGPSGRLTPSFIPCDARRILSLVTHVLHKQPSCQ